MSDVIIACDFSSKEETLKFLDQFKEEKPFVKIGMELFYAEGGEIVKEKRTQNIPRSETLRYPKYRLQSHEKYCSPRC